MTTATKTLADTVAAAGFAVQAVPPVLPSHKRLLADGFLVDTDDGILRYATAEDVEQSHMLDDEGECYWADIIGIYQVKSGVITACDMEGWAREETQERKDNEEDAEYRENLKYL